MQKSLGHVSTMTDLWSDHNRNSFMAVTAHFMMQDDAGQLVLKSHLIAFRYIEGSHSGANLGKCFVQIIDEMQFLHKVFATSDIK
ncbi:hypothetical protein EDB19DRAFT_1633716 [Suillus lakei]|nr:hypothetical protein EDB19DRAFT_1633716 [Suillus lakei]